MVRKVLSLASLFVLLLLLLVLAPATPASSPWTCSDLITPERVGHEEFDRLGIAEKLENEQFLRIEAGGYLLCSHDARESQHAPPQMRSDLYYLFKAGSGELVVTRVTWDEGYRQRESAPPPTPQPAEVMAGSTADSVEICIDIDTPVGIGGEPPEQRGIFAILGSSECKVVMESQQFCWACGAGAELACLDAEGALDLDGSRTEGEASGVPLENQECVMALGGGELCWECRETPPASADESDSRGPEQEAQPTEPEQAEASCRDYMTADTLGREAYEHYGLAEMLGEGQFQEKVSDNTIICWADRTIGEVEVYGDELYFRFDLETGDLLKTRAHWREDLPEKMPTPLISRQEAEAMVEGQVQRSNLKVMSPDGPDLGIWFGDDPDRRRVQRSTSIFEHPVWFVWSREVRITEGHDLDIVWITVIDAMTGQVLGRTCPC